MRNTLAPILAVVTCVKIVKDRKTGWYILTSQQHELGRLAAALDRNILKRIAMMRQWKVVRVWPIWD